MPDPLTDSLKDEFFYSSFSDYAYWKTNDFLYRLEGAYLEMFYYTW